ncbi:PEP-CTERM system histidine kinase PrsK [Altererythrobacter arenosus]|uniref:histidine kinase n=1 Tax=Altererythrobacter arenosus TaxID=3032592 RepID=A0ABY8FPH3_9SPHN|nr:XrtA/PEP-CTERM system histidine kinase PrsK [Altererythrobacter sp. CAU 1644]WFL76904.1 PEP-CTERM system histidine kinase PrsK [Altererythrobacter sp. CAU 1644]
MNLANWPFLPFIGFLGHLAGAIACTIGVWWIATHGDRNRHDRTATIAAGLTTGIWCLLSAAFGPDAIIAEVAEIARNLAWIFLLFRLFGNDGRDESVRQVRPVVVALLFVECLQPVLLLVEHRFAITPQIDALTNQISAALRMLVAIGGLMLLHNLYAGAAKPSRELLRWSTIAVGGFWAFDLNFFTVGYLGGQHPALLEAIRGLAAAVLILPLALGSSATAAGLQFRPSRAVAFQTLSLLLIGAYLLLMMLMTRSIAMLGGDFARFTQVGFVVAATIATILWLPSPRLRGWLKVTATKHLFQHRYDYRQEWLRFNATIGRGGANGESFEERAIRAIADITDSPAGLLLAPNEEVELELVEHWKWPSLEVPAVAACAALSSMLEEQEFILDLDEARARLGEEDQIPFVPAWMLDEPRAWAVVPLLHFERLVGAIVLARPAAHRSLDWEDFDLLRVVGRQLASYLAERAGQQALMEASRFDEFNRRIAFVMHDIKNLASQVTLLARNAEKHADNPEFRADMLVTLRNSGDKLNALLKRLGRYGAGQVDAREPLALDAFARDLVAKYARQHSVTVAQANPVLVLANREALDQSLTHLLQNAIDASADGAPIYVNVVSDGTLGCLEIIDSGGGMSPQFIRNGLFKPFVSSKDGGFGIGAFEARELIRAMGGRLKVESREGIGTRFMACLPLEAAAQIQASGTNNDSEVA